MTPSKPLTTLLAVSGFGAALCAQSLTIPNPSATAATITVGPTVVRDPAANPLLLGFNVEWQSVQAPPGNNSNLWDGTLKQIRPALPAFLKTDFSGAVYRYPGGTPANYFDWEKSVGPLAGRSPILNPFAGTSHVVQFGLHEALNFAESVGGTVLPLMNLLSMNGVKITTSAQWTQLRQKQLGFFEYCNAPTNADWNGDGVFQGQLRANNGRAASWNLPLWELGNELDPHLDHATYLARCADLIAAMRAQQPDLDFLVHARTSAWQPAPTPLPKAPFSVTSTESWRDWHNALLDQLGGDILGLAYHPYYDGNNITYTNSFTQHIWNDSQLSVGGAAAPGVFLTEHARWPYDIDNQATWPVTTSIRGAISVADMIIAQAQRPHIQMALNHDLASGGPWALFTPVDPGTGLYTYGTTFAPRPLAHALRIAHRSLENAQVLQTSITTPKPSDYEYSVRATGYRHGAAGPAGALLVNRALQGYPLTLTLPGWTAGSRILRLEGIGGADEAAPWTSYVPVEVGSGGSGALKLPAQAVVNALAVGENHAGNGDLETAQANGLPSSWEKRLDGTATGTVSLPTDAASLNGTKVARLQITGGAGGGLTLVQPSWLNAALGSAGVVGQNPDDSFVFRANVRTAGVGAGKVGLKLQAFSTAGYLGASPVLLSAPADSAGRWLPIELEFVPSRLLAGATFSRVELVLVNSSLTGHADFDGVTLQRRQNHATNPGFVAGTSGWVHRNTGTATITHHGSAAPAYVRLAKSVAADTNQFLQIHTSTSALNGRQNEKWRLRANIRHTGLNAAGAQLKVQFFKSGGAYLATSPLGPTLTGTSAASGSAWVETALEFHPRDVLGAADYGYAEIMLQNSSPAGHVDVRFMSLEAVD